MIRLPSADLSLNLLHIVQLTSCLLVPDHHGGVDRAPGRAGGQPRHHGRPRQQGHRGQALPPGPGGDNHNDDDDEMMMVTVQVISSLVTFEHLSLMCGNPCVASPPGSSLQTQDQAQPGHDWSHRSVALLSIISIAYY